MIENNVGVWLTSIQRDEYEGNECCGDSHPDGHNPSASHLELNRPVGLSEDNLPILAEREVNIGTCAL